MTDTDRLQMLLNTATQIAMPAMLWWVSATALSVTISGLVRTDIGKLRVCHIFRIRSLPQAAPDTPYNLRIWILRLYTNQPFIPSPSSLPYFRF